MIRLLNVFFAAVGLLLSVVASLMLLWPESPDDVRASPWSTGAEPSKGLLSEGHEASSLGDSIRLLSGAS